MQSAKNQIGPDVLEALIVRIVLVFRLFMIRGANSLVTLRCRFGILLYLLVWRIVRLENQSQFVAE